MNKVEAAWVKSGNLLPNHFCDVHLSNAYSIFPLGDSAITIDLGNCIEDQLNMKAIAIHDWLQAHRFPGIRDIIVAYSSVSILYDPTVVRTGSPNKPSHVYYYLKELMEQAWAAVTTMIMPESQSQGGHFFRVPVCYEGELAPDLAWVAEQKGITKDEVVRLHCEEPYRVYMIGFLPGFSYMGRPGFPLEIPRKKQPVPVLAGGVGIAGMQTGIYPLNSPGGWQIIGRTPIPFFRPDEDPPVRLQAGDHVQFYPVAKEEFYQLSQPARR